MEANILNELRLMNEKIDLIINLLNKRPGPVPDLSTQNHSIKGEIQERIAQARKDMDQQRLKASFKHLE